MPTMIRRLATRLSTLTSRDAGKGAGTRGAQQPPPPSDRLATLAHAFREHGDVIPFRGARLFAHPDAVRDILLTHDRSFTKSPALRKARFSRRPGVRTG